MYINAQSTLDHFLELCIILSISSLPSISSSDFRSIDIDSCRSIFCDLLISISQKISSYELIILNIVIQEMQFANNWFRSPSRDAIFCHQFASLKRCYLLILSSKLSKTSNLSMKSFIYFELLISILSLIKICDQVISITVVKSLRIDYINIESNHKFRSIDLDIWISAIQCSCIVFDINQKLRLIIKYCHYLRVAIS